MFKTIIALLFVAFVAAGCVSVPVDDRPVVAGLHLGKNILSRPLAADARLPRGCTYDNDGTKYGSVLCEQARAPVRQYVETPVYVAPVCGPYGCPVVAPAYSSVQIWRGGFAVQSGPMYGPMFGPAYVPVRQCNMWWPYNCWYR